MGIAVINFDGLFMSRSDTLLDFISRERIEEKLITPFTFFTYFMYSPPPILIINKRTVTNIFLDNWLDIEDVTRCPILIYNP